MTRRIRTVCPACSCKLATPHATRRQVATCARCSALFTLPGESLYLGDSYSLVLPCFSPNPDAPALYFDFSTLGSNGPGRRHGWYDPETRMLTQIG